MPTDFRLGLPLVVNPLQAVVDYLNSLQYGLFRSATIPVDWTNLAAYNQPENSGYELKSATFLMPDTPAPRSSMPSVRLSNGKAIRQRVRNLSMVGSPMIPRPARSCLRCCTASSNHSSAWGRSGSRRISRSLARPLRESGPAVDRRYS